MTTEQEEPKPVRVSLAAIEHGLSLGPQPQPQPAARRKVVSFETYLLTADDPVQAILPENPSRHGAYVQAFDNNAVLCSSHGQAAKNADTADLSVAATQVYGQLISKANGSMMPVEGTNAVWAACATAKPARISVQVIDYQ